MLQACRARRGNDSFTKLLLHCDGADTSTTFTDSSASAHTVTTVGNAQVDTAQSKFGGESGLFDGSGDRLTLDGSSDFAFGTGDFTIDFWVRFASTSGFQGFYSSNPASTNGAYVWIRKDSSHHLSFVANGSTAVITGTTVLATGTWYHVALARSGTSTKLFLNGVQEGSTYSDSTNYLNPAGRPYIGSDAWDTTQQLNGWIDELRVSKGIARWTANFTPPTLPYSRGGKASAPSFAVAA